MDLWGGSFVHAKLRESIMGKKINVLLGTEWTVGI